MANPLYAKKRRLIKQIKELPAEYIILDIGSGTSFNVLDFFAMSDSGLVVVLPEPTAIENLYRFLKGALLRMLWFSVGKDTLNKFSWSYSDFLENINYRDINDLFEQLEWLDKRLPEKLEGMLKSFKPMLIVNQVRDKKDINLGVSIPQVIKRFLGINVNCLGCVPYDSTVPQSFKRFKPFLLESPNCPASVLLQGIAAKLIDPESRRDRFRR